MPTTATPQPRVPVVRLTPRGSSVILLLVLSLSVSGPVVARQSPSLPDLAGRWHDARRDVTLDIRGCGDDWCGVAVRGGQCGARVLRLETPRPVTQPESLRGRLDLTEPARRFEVRATVIEGVIHLSGDDHTPAWLRRTVPLTWQLARIGAAQCALPATS